MNIKCFILLLYINHILSSELSHHYNAEQPVVLSLRVDRVGQNAARSKLNLTEALSDDAGNRNTSNIITNVIKFDSKLNHLLVDTITGRVFVGGVNRLYQLSPDLELHETVKTGPQNDSVECTILDCPLNAVRKPTDNYNKVLLIDRATSRLIACGSLFQGTCTVRNLQNVSIVEHEVPDAVVSNDANSSTVAFIAPGPPQHPVTNVMYVGVTYTNNSPYRSEIPAVASRSLEKTKMFQIASSAVTTGTRTFINSYARETYLVNYVYGFSSERFSYFLTTQLKHSHHSSPKEYITKLVRICQEDSNYYSYTEIPVECISEAQGGTKFNLVQAGFLGKPSSDLAQSLGISIQDDVLFAVFSKGESNVPTNNSALCIFSLKSIRRKFMQNIKFCFNGNGMRGLDFISPSMPCVLTVCAKHFYQYTYVSTYQRIEISNALVYFANLVHSYRVKKRCIKKRFIPILLIHVFLSVAVFFTF